MRKDYQGTPRARQQCNGRDCQASSSFLQYPATPIRSRVKWADEDPLLLGQLSAATNRLHPGNARDKEGRIKLIFTVSGYELNGQRQQPSGQQFIPKVITYAKEGSRLKIVDNRKVDNSGVLVENGIQFIVVPKDVHQPIADPNNRRWVKGTMDAPLLQQCS